MVGNCLHEKTEDLQRPACQVGVSKCRAGQGEGCNLSTKRTCIASVQVARSLRGVERTSVGKLSQVSMLLLPLAILSSIKEPNGSIACD